MTVAYRPANAGDRNFIVSGWSTSFKSAHAAGMIAMEDWAAIMHPQIERVLDREDCTTLVAYETTESPGLVDLHGFIAGRREPIWSPVAKRDLPMVFYVYVKGPYRCRGFATGLFKALGVNPRLPFVYTSKTSWCSLLATSVPLGKWDPLLSRFPPPDKTCPIVEVKRGR